MLVFLQIIVYIDEILIVMLILFSKKVLLFQTTWCLNCDIDGFFTCDIMTLTASSHVIVHLTFINML